MRILFNVGFYSLLGLAYTQLMHGQHCSYARLEVENKTDFPITIVYTTQTGINEIRIEAGKIHASIVCLHDIKTIAIQEQNKVWTRISLDEHIRRLMQEVVVHKDEHALISVEKVNEKWRVLSKWKE